MRVKRLHIVGGGLAGLACAVRALDLGMEVSLYEASPHFGGRCRSFVDPHLGLIDGGSHLMLTANCALLEYNARCGAQGLLRAGEAIFPFVDLTSGERWTIAPGQGRIPWWLFSPDRRCPDGGALAHAMLARLRWAKPGQTVSDLFAQSPLYLRLIVPLTVAILNTEPHAASAKLLGRVLEETLFQGGAACRPLFAPSGLSAALIDPAVRTLESRGARLVRKTPIKSLIRGQKGDVMGLETQHGLIPVTKSERVIIAVPPRAAGRLLPDIPALEQRRITNAHFALPTELTQLCLPPLLGVIGGRAEWIFQRDGVVSVTISAAPAAAPDLLASLWRDVVQALALPPSTPCPAGRVIHYHEATLAQTPQAEEIRARFAKYPIILAGDWVGSNVPCTIEGAIRSGNKAAERALE